MNWNEYLKMSEKTLSYSFFTDEKTQVLLHGIIGIITELEELIEWKSDIIGKSEEIADVFWYLAIFSREYNIDFNYYKKELSFLDKVKHTIFKQKLSSKVILDMYKESSLVLDMYKKKLFYNKEINEQKLVEHIKTLFKLSSEYCLINNIDISVSLDRNISKLKQRYGDKFSTEKAINRDLDKERDILEGK